MGADAYFNEFDVLNGVSRGLGMAGRNGFYE
jgi:hypothetical protein